MRRSVAILAAFLLVQSAALRSGILCEQAIAQAPVTLHGGQPGHSHGAPAQPSPTQHHSQSDATHCGLMVNCGVVSIAAPSAESVTSARSATVALPIRAVAPHSFSKAPEPPPPKA